MLWFSPSSWKSKATASFVISEGGYVIKSNPRLLPNKFSLEPWPSYHSPHNHVLLSSFPFLPQPLLRFSILLFSSLSKISPPLTLSQPFFSTIHPSKPFVSPSRNSLIGSPSSRMHLIEWTKKSWWVGQFSWNRWIVQNETSSQGRDCERGRLCADQHSWHFFN